jgi:hypothetical protein
LDGEAAESADAQQANNPKSSSEYPTSLQELAKWTPEANKAEGSAQFDYLARLGDVIAGLDRDLWRRGRSRVSAVGIIGSDVYDTLLILQALRNRLPDAVFFTTDLDARFWNPTELDWSRNLIVLSGYGLRLKDGLQSGVAPFRESAQCAQFLATLNALRDETLPPLDLVSPRRFEIGRAGPVDMSVTNEMQLHPPVRSPLGSLWKWLAAALLILAAAGLLGWKPLRQLAFPSRDYCREPLALTPDDFGGPEGLRGILKNLGERKNDNLAQWLLEGASESTSESKDTEEFSLDDFKDMPGFATRLKPPQDDVSKYLLSLLSESTKNALDHYQSFDPVPGSLQAALVKELQHLIQRKCCLFDESILPDSKVMRKETCVLRQSSRVTGADQEHLNRLLLEEAFPQELGKRAEKEGQKQQLNGLIARCNAAIFMKDPGRLPPKDIQTSQALLDSLARLNDGKKLHNCDVFANRKVINDLLKIPSDEKGKSTRAAFWAREIALSNYRNRCMRAWLFWLAAVLLGGGFLALAFLAWRDTYVVLKGEPFNFSGTSAWPAEFIRFSVFALSVLVIIKTQRMLSQCIMDITRRYRLNLDFATTSAQPERSSKPRLWQFWTPEPPVTDAEVDANQLWGDSQRTRHWKARLLRVLGCVGIYLCFGILLSKLAGKPFAPIRGDMLARLNLPLLFCATIGFLLVTFWMIDAAQNCAWVIRQLSRAPTRYPKATVDHFKQQRSVEDGSLVEEWIDLQLIADLTESVGRLVYWPFLAVLLMFVARNPWWDRWTWHWPLLTLFAINMGLAAASSLILQRSALKARETGVKHLQEKVNQKQRQAAASVVEHESNQATQLLDEINALRRGAFAPLSKNPLVGALLANSSGLVVMQVLAIFISK